MKKLIAFVLLMALCLSVSACSQEGSNQSVTEPSSAQQNTQTTLPSKETDPTQETKPVVTQPQQNMCYWCDEMPVGDFETYCVNCRCLKCDNLRKDAGRYLYCRQHNCNESLCEYPAFEDSQYCSEHKCSKPNCDNRRWSGSEYCASHK